MADIADLTVARRLGYEGIAACAVVDAAIPIEAALMRPTGSESNWRTAFHAGFDPRNPEAGSVRLVKHPDEASARRTYQEHLAYDHLRAIADMEATWHSPVHDHDGPIRKAAAS